MTITIVAAMLIVKIGGVDVFAKHTTLEEAEITALMGHTFIKTSAVFSVDDVEEAFFGHDASELRLFLLETPYWVVGTRLVSLFPTLNGVYE